MNINNGHRETVTVVDQGFGQNRDPVDIGWNRFEGKRLLVISGRKERKHWIYSGLWLVDLCRDDSNGTGKLFSYGQVEEFLGSGLKDSTLVGKAVLGT